ncbi:hypothetical protein [Massilia aquatica]|uniref:Uncharacterized protein n=1 Tax=Massilia aquatica TaxID=2609000 RepID=A0ABX0LYP4_9BURK|nr:hypothetical protein [Massilia aquatica]NHZ39672.1 hypothetical protein [Massilia aquatica]
MSDLAGFRQFDKQDQRLLFQASIRNLMDIYCETQPVPVHQVVTVDMFTNLKTEKPFSSLPTSLQFQPKIIECDGVKKTVMVPVATVEFVPLNAKGDLVARQDAVLVRISYYDEEGRRLSTTTLRKNAAK